MSGVTIQAECLLPGTAAGQVALLSAPLSLWGGFDLESGRICDANHPQHGMTIAGRILDAGRPRFLVLVQHPAGVCPPGYPSSSHRHYRP